MMMMMMILLFPRRSFTFFIIIVSLLLTRMGDAGPSDLLPTILPGIFVSVPDYNVLTPELITSRGFGYERHHVSVPDGFSIAIHRIIHPFLPQTRATVLMFHGITGSAQNYLDTEFDGFIHEPLTYYSANTAFELAKRGYDVWLVDQRATYFSSNNSFYTKTDREYWNWSIDEIALYDLPATIDYITAYTGRKNIGYVGHSQGTLSLFMLMSRVPKYNQIIRPFIALAPVFFLSHVVLTQSPQLRQIPYQEWEKYMRHQNAPFLDARINDFLTFYCRFLVISVTQCQPLGYLLLTFFSPFINPVPPDINYERIPVYLTASLFFTVSNKQLAQYFQMVQSNIPRALDQTPEENRKRYGTPVPPIYDPALITCDSIALISSLSDVVADPTDVQTFRDILKVKLFADLVITDPTFGHGTFVVGNHGKVVDLVVKPVIEILDHFY